MEWNEYTIPIEEAKNFFRVEHDLDDALISELIAAAIETAGTSMNRTFDTVPASVTLAIKQTALYWYDNRTDTDTVPAPAQKVFDQYYLNPGL